jgi:choline kinase
VSAALILAAGRGSRLGGLTADRPKCLTPLAGRPLLEWQVAALRAAGASPVVAVGGYRAGTLRGRTDRLLLNPRWSETNMVATLACAAELLESGPVVVSYADIVYDAAHVRALDAAGGDIALTNDRDWARLWRARSEHPLSDAESFRVREGRVLEIGGRAARMEEIEGQYMGLLRFTPAGWGVVARHLAALPAAAVDRLDMTGLLGALVAAGVPVEGVAVEGGWCEVDTEADLRIYENALAGADRWSHDWRGGSAW